MGSMRSKLRRILIVPLAVLFLVLGFLPLHSVSAQNMTVGHSMDSMAGGVVNCAAPCANSVANMPEKRKPVIRDEEQDPEPPEQTPYYAQHFQFPEPQKPANNYAFSGVLLRPPDLVKLYSNFRF